MRQNRQTGLDCRFGGPTTAAIDGHLPNTRKERTAEHSLDALTSEVLTLRKECDATGRHQRQEDRIAEGHMVRSKDRSTLPREVLLPEDAWTKQDAQRRTDDRNLEEPVQHAGKATAAGARAQPAGVPAFRHEP